MTAGLAHHMENVLNLADKKAGWRCYDDQFRHLLGSGMAAWGATHLELYMKSHLECPSTSNRPGTTPRAQHPLANTPLGACYRYHSLGQCTEGNLCKFQHNCYNCLAGHPASRCPSHSTRHTKPCRGFLAEGTRGIRQVDSPFRTPPQPRAEDQTKKGVGAHPSKLPTPVRAARLEAWLEGYDGGQTQKLVSGFKRSFSPRVRPHNLISALQNPEEVDKKLSKESSMKGIAGPFQQESFSHFKTSPLRPFEKKIPGKFRLIHHLSYPPGDSINGGISPEDAHVQYQSIDHAVQQLQQLGQGVFFGQKQTLQMPFALSLCTHRNTACSALSGANSSIMIVACPWVAMQAAIFLRHLAMCCNG